MEPDYTWSAGSGSATAGDAHNSSVPSSSLALDAACFFLLCLTLRREPSENLLQWDGFAKWQAEHPPELAAGIGAEEANTIEGEDGKPAKEEAAVDDTAEEKVEEGQEEEAEEKPAKKAKTGRSKKK